MRIVFHGDNAATFSDNFAALVDDAHDVRVLPDVLTTSRDRDAYAEADIIIGGRFQAGLPAAATLRLFHVPGAGYDAVDLDALPAGAVVCNCFGHEQAIAEYVLAALLLRHVPLADADARLRQGDWAYWAGARERTHEELAGKTIGLLGYGHIGKAIAARARAFEMQVHVANRSVVAPSPLVDRSYALQELAPFWSSADFFVVSLPLTAATAGIVDSRAFAAMRPSAVIVNVGRGHTIDERALYDALAHGRIGGAIIDTWYNYPSPGAAHPMPSALPFHALPNIVMTPHMSGWTSGTIRRRQLTMAANIKRLVAGQPLQNVVRPAQTAAGR